MLRDHFLEPADVGGVGADQLHPPALLGGEALVHPVEVGGEQRGLLAAGAGADLEHRRTHVGGIARQHCEREPVLGLGQVGAQPRDLLGHERAHLGIAIAHRLKRGELASHVAQRQRRARDRLELGIVAAGGDELGTLERPRSEPRLELGEARGDLVEAGIGDGHGLDPADRAEVAGAKRLRER